MLSAGLVAAYAFDESAGTTAADASGAGNAGTLANGPLWTAAGKYGGALSFDGVNDIVNIAASTSLDLTNGMTLEAWVKPSTQGGYRTVVMKDVPGELAYALYGSGDTNRPNAWARVSGTSQDATGTAALPLNACPTRVASVLSWIATAGESPVIVSTSGRGRRPRNCFA